MNPSKYKLLSIVATILTGLCAAVPSEVPKCSPDWQIEVIAEAPKLVHPSVVCTAPDGRIFVGQDFMDMAGPCDKPIDSILCFHPNGRITLFATNLYAVFGLSYLDGKLFVHHCPMVSVFEDWEGIGRNRRDLFTSNPEPCAGTGLNDHIPANFRLAMDGYFYMAVGDKGIHGAKGTDGKHAELAGGGVLRFRPDGSELEVYCNGTRNHPDLAINAEDEIFTFDNTDDGEGWWTRVTHMVDGGFYGYPYDYRPRRPYTLWAMSDYGAGAPTGAICYEEDALPKEYRGNLFFCDWAKGQILRLVVERAGGSFTIKKREVIVEKGASEFRPVGIEVTADGAGFLMTDWNHDGWRSSKPAGRLLCLRFRGPSEAHPKPVWYTSTATRRETSASMEQFIEGLKHPSRNVRLAAQRRLAEKGAGAIEPLIDLITAESVSAHARASAIWTIEAIDRQNSLGARSAITKAQSGEQIKRVMLNKAGAAILSAARTGDIETQLQILRVIGACGSEGMFVSPHATEVLLSALRHVHAAVRFQAAAALGRSGGTETIPALLSALDDSDLFSRYSVFHALNRIARRHSNTWKAIIGGLNHDNPAIREGVIFAVRETFDQENVHAMAAFIQESTNAAVARSAALETLVDLHRRYPDRNGKWWGIQPVRWPAPQKSRNWEGSVAVLGAVRAALNDPDTTVLRTAIEGVTAIHDMESAGVLSSLFWRSDLECRRLIIRSLATLKTVASEDLLVECLGAPNRHPEILADMVLAAGRIGGRQMLASLSALVGSSEDSSIKVRILEAFGHMQSAEAIPILKSHLHNTNAILCAAAAGSLQRIGGETAIAAINSMLDDSRPEIRRLGVATLGPMKSKLSLPKLLKAYEDEETRDEAIAALAARPDMRALDMYLAGLQHTNSSIREVSHRAVEWVRYAALPIIEEKLKARRLSKQILPRLRIIYRNVEKARSGQLFNEDDKLSDTDAYAKYASTNRGDPVRGRFVFFDLGPGACGQCHRLKGEGGQIGPALDGVGQKYNRNQIIESILYPSKSILNGYEQSLVFTRDGQISNGVLRNESPDQVSLSNAEGRRLEIRRTDIISIKPSETSVMPEGLEGGMSIEDFSNLVSFLEKIEE